MKNPEYERLLSPTPLEFVALMAEIFGPFLHKVATFNVTNFILTSLGHGFDPDGSRLPEWPAAKPVPAPTEEIELKSGGFPVAFDGELRRSEPETRPQVKAAKEVANQTDITLEEYEMMKAYNPPLHNVGLAMKIKGYWQEGKGDREIAALVGRSESYIKHHRVIFQKAAKGSDPSPTFG